jgi:DNA-binding transcriptional regulator LsrR (DeoR family)
MKGRKLTTGRFETRAELESEVWDRYLNTPSTQSDIARFARVSTTTVANILKRTKPCPHPSKP